MRAIICFFLLGNLMCLTACKHYLFSDEKQQQRYPPDTYVYNDFANDMKENYRCDDCRDTEAVTIDKTLLKLIQKEIPDIKKWQLVRARYKTEDDKKRYANRHGYKMDDERADVIGHSTFLLEIVSSKNRLDYFDIFTICPPPRGCISEYLLSAE